MFRRGEYGMHTLNYPSVLDGCLESDGRAKLSNGKSTVAALQQLFQEWDAGKEAADWAVGAILSVFEGSPGKTNHNKFKVVTIKSSLFQYDMIPASIFANSNEEYERNLCINIVQQQPRCDS